MSRFSLRVLKCPNCRHEGHWFLRLRIANGYVRACRYCRQPVYPKARVDSIPFKDPNVLRTWDEERV